MNYLFHFFYGVGRKGGRRHISFYIFIIIFISSSCVRIFSWKGS